MLARCECGQWLDRKPAWPVRWVEDRKGGRTVCAECYRTKYDPKRPIAAEVPNNARKDNRQLKLL